MPAIGARKMFFFSRFFNNSSFVGGRHSSFGTPFDFLARSGVRTLVFFALVLIALGVLMLLFPLFPAICVASLLFFIALLCLKFAWRIHRVQRQPDPNRSDVHIEILPPDPDQS